MKKHIVLLLIICLILTFCKEKSKPSKQSVTTTETLSEHLEGLNERIANAAIQREFDLISDLYLDSTLLIAAYQPLLDGKHKIKAFYVETYHRQDLADYSRETVEIIDFENYVLEIGLFQKLFSDGSQLQGKYFNNWLKGTDGKLYLRAESFGFFGEPENKEDYRVMFLTDDNEPLKGRNGKIIPMELQVYNAFGENLVRDRNTQGVVDSYTKDGIYFPFADTAKTGYDGLLKHFTAYHKYPVKIDSIEVWTYDYDQVDDGIIRYNRFFVRWTLPDGNTGESSGAGIAYWKRTSDNTLKTHRHIGTHIY